MIALFAILGLARLGAAAPIKSQLVYSDEVPTTLVANAAGCTDAFINSTTYTDVVRHCEDQCAGANLCTSYFVYTLKFDEAPGRCCLYNSYNPTGKRKQYPGFFYEMSTSAPTSSPVTTLPTTNPTTITPTARRIAATLVYADQEPTVSTAIGTCDTGFGASGYTDEVMYCEDKCSAASGCVAFFVYRKTHAQNGKCCLKSAYEPYAVTSMPPNTGWFYKMHTWNNNRRFKLDPFTDASGKTWGWANLIEYEDTNGCIDRKKITGNYYMRPNWCYVDRNKPTTSFMIKGNNVVYYSDDSCKTVLPNSPTFSSDPNARTCYPQPYTTNMHYQLKFWNVRSIDDSMDSFIRKVYVPGKTTVGCKGNYYLSVWRTDECRPIAGQPGVYRQEKCLNNIQRSRQDYLDMGCTIPKDHQPTEKTLLNRCIADSVSHIHYWDYGCDHMVSLPGTKAKCMSASLKGWCGPNSAICPGGPWTYPECIEQCEEREDCNFLRWKKGSPNKECSLLRGCNVLNTTVAYTSAGWEYRSKFDCEFDQVDYAGEMRPCVRHPDREKTCLQ